MGVPMMWVRAGERQAGVMRHHQRGREGGAWQVGRVHPLGGQARATSAERARVTACPAWAAWIARAVPPGTGAEPGSAAIASWAAP